MADGTKIEWTDATWNPVTGCSVVSPGCKHCYAMRLAGGRMKNHPSRAGLTQPTDAGPVWTGEVRFNEQWLNQPLDWSKPRMIFVCAHCDLFHEDVPDDWIDRIFAIMALCPQHTFQVLTKRAERMRDYMRSCTLERLAASVPTPSNPRMSKHEVDARITASPPAVAELYHCSRPEWPLRNVWLGVSVEDQKRADERVPHLLDTPAAVRWVSAEPLLGPVDLSGYLRVAGGSFDGDPLAGAFMAQAIEDGTGWARPALDWVVAGGESGPGSRPMHPHWVERIRDDCAAVGVPFHFKQWGDWVPALQFPAGIDDDPEQSRFASVVWDGSAWEETNGHWTDREQWAIAECGQDPEQQMFRVGKKRAGRLIDGVTHDVFPEVRAGS